MVLPTSSILIRIWVEFLIGQFILEVNFSIRLGPMRWVPTAHCAGRRGLNLLTAVSPVELAHWITPLSFFKVKSPHYSIFRSSTFCLFLLNIFHIDATLVTAYDSDGVYWARDLLFDLRSTWLLWSFRSLCQVMWNTIMDMTASYIQCHTYGNAVGQSVLSTTPERIYESSLLQDMHSDLHITQPMGMWLPFCRRHF